jgi:hypothetical protein
VQCSCGSPEFIVRKDSYDQGRSKSCGFCRKGGRRRLPAPVIAPVVEQVVEQKITPEVVSTFERGTPAWYADEISRVEAAALAAENRLRYLELQLAEQTTTDLDTHKRWNTEMTTAHKLRREVSRLQVAKDKAETGTKKDTRTQAEITRDRIRALKGDAA